MSAERRSRARASLGRRRSERTSLYTYVKWRDEVARCDRQGVLVGIGEGGLAMLIEGGGPPSVGSFMKLRIKDRRWRREARVVRVDHVSPGLDLVAAEYEL